MFSISTPHVMADISAEAAMLQHVSFKLDTGRSFEPFARSLWSETDAINTGLPGHLRWLGAEFVCVPFGVGGPLDQVSPGWRDLRIDAENVPPHGYSANEIWRVVEQETDRLALELDYPADHAISRLRRTVAGSHDGPWLDLSLTIESHSTLRTSLGLHPILSLDQPAASLGLHADFEFGLTYPAAVPGNATAAALGQTFTKLESVPGKGGGLVDLSRLPREEATEDVLLLCRVRNAVEITFLQQRAALRIDWDHTLLPSCQIWISDRALQTPPWNGRYRGLGVEPVAAAFDFADQVSTADNPVSARGVATCLTIEPDKPITFRYRLEAVDLSRGGMAVLAGL